MKLIIAHLASDALDAVRGELRQLCVKTTISEMHSPSLKLECVAASEQSRAVVRLLRGHTDDIMSVVLRPAAHPALATRTP